MESINSIKFLTMIIHRKIKKLLACAMVTLAASAMATNVKAQIFAEWFSQGSAQKKYLLQQLAYLKLLNSSIKLGNSIAGHGLGSISGSLKNENGLHAAYYNKLQVVSPLVKTDKQVSEITGWQKDILTRTKGLDKTPSLNSGEQQYVLQVTTALLADCNEQITQLQNIITDGILQMSDADRLNHIGVIHAAMLDNYRFASKFANEVKVYAARRVQENNETLTTGKIYGIQ